MTHFDLDRILYDEFYHVVQQTDVVVPAFAETRLSHKHDTLAHPVGISYRHFCTQKT